jgi:4-hydroxyacetophenone monooxygenase
MVSRKYGVHDNTRFERNVVKATFDEARDVWVIEAETPDGIETIEGNVIVNAVGTFTNPKFPNFEGQDSFEGQVIHPSRWPDDIDLTGKRVAVVGSGASAFQLVPEVAKTASHVVVFQRSAPWMVPNPRYHSRVSAAKKWLLTHVPYYARWYRFLLFWPGSDGLMPSLVVDPEWEHPARSVNAVNDMMREMFIQFMADQIGDDPELLAKVTPSYPPFGKRMLQDNGSWLGALKRENVELVTDRITEIGPRGVRTADGTEHAADVIVYATGFHANRFLWPMEIAGRGGVSLREQWGDEPRAYLGITVPRFPNLFCLYGPGTNLGHAGSIIFHAECQVRYVMGCLAALLRNGHRTIECRQDVHDAYNARFDARHETLVWAHPGMGSWYKNASGKVVNTSPWRLVDYWGWTKMPDLADFELR